MRTQITRQLQHLDDSTDGDTLLAPRTVNVKATRHSTASQANATHDAETKDIPPQVYARMIPLPTLYVDLLCKYINLKTVSMDEIRDCRIEIVVAIPSLSG